MPLIPQGAPYGPPMGGMGPDPTMGMPPDPLAMALAAREQLDALIALLMGPQLQAAQPPPVVGGDAVGF